MSLLKQVAERLNPFAQGPISQAGITRGMSTKNLSSFIGTGGAGKTTVDCLFLLTARTLQQRLPGFYCDVDDRNSKIMSEVSDLQRGHFPRKTDAYQNYAHQYALNMWWDGPWGRKSAILNNIDLAGEDFMANSQYQFEKPDDMSGSQAMKLVQLATMSDVLILAAPASRALLFEDDAQIEIEAEDTAFDPDVNLASITGEIFTKRREMHKPLKGVILVITKTDMVKPYLVQKHKWDIFDNPEDRVAFINTYFPFTSMKLKALSGWSKTPVAIFPMFVDTKKEASGKVKRWEDGPDKGHPIIEIDSTTRLPSYGSGFCVEIINFMGKIVA